MLADGSESSTELKLEFRTSEPNGVLLAAAGLLLQLKDGAVSIFILNTFRYTWTLFQLLPIDSLTYLPFLPTARRV